jgi:ribulose-phosphate 3-epimerase
VKIHPSILSADFANLEAELKTISAADAVHVDVMDNHFVPNLTLGLPVVSRLNEVSELPLDVHLMIENVEHWAPKYAETGVSSVTFHLEATSQPIDLARRIRSIGSKAAVAIKPGTAVDAVLPILNEIDMLLVMTVEPGFGGQKLIEATLDKVAQAAKHIRSHELTIALQVDGGVTESNIAQLSALGADTFVAGSAVFGHQNRNLQIENLRRLASTHSH